MNVHKNNTMSTIYDVQRGSNNNKNLLLLVLFLTHMWFWVLPFFRCILLLYTSLNFYYCKEKVYWLCKQRYIPALAKKKTPIMWFDIWGTLILYFYFLYFYFQIRSLGNKKDCRCDNNNYLAIGRICLLRTNILWPP